MSIQILDYPRKALDSVYRFFNGSYRGDFTQTYTGKIFYPLDPELDSIDIYDIAHHLSMLCRWNGACRYFYSIAEHSVRVARFLSNQSPKVRLTALLHDASEAYLSDITRPVKNSKYLRGYKKIERNMERVIALKFALLYPFPNVIKEADNILLGTEARDLFPAIRKNWHLSLGSLPGKIEPWTQEVAKQQFMQEFYDIIDARTDQIINNLNNTD